MKTFFRKAQLDPGTAPPPPPPPTGAAPAAPSVAPPMPDMGMTPGLGMPPPPPMPGLGPTDPMAAGGASGVNRQEVIGPIDSLAQIFYDLDIAKFILNNLQIDSKKLASKIWEDFGGKPDGQTDSSKSGKRTEQNAKASPEDAAQERDRTENSKWERLAKGKTIGDIISLDDLGKVVEGLIYGVIQKSGTAAAAPPGGAPPMGGGLFASNNARIIIAQALEKRYDFYLADAIINDIIKSVS